MSIPFERSFASHEKSAFWSSKNEKKPEEVYKSSGKKYWFECNICSHSFDTALYNIVGGCWCPYCSNPSKKLCESIDCNLCFNNSFASHEKSEFWSTKNECQSREVFNSSNIKYWFDCQKCKHSFESTLNHIVNGTWCPYCSNPSKTLCDSSICELCFNNSFASHEKSEFWSSKNEYRPREIFKSSHRKYWFDCQECKHSFDAELNSIIGGRWCPYCSNKKICDSIDCNLCFNNSFASHEKSTFWSSKNEYQPRDVFKGTHSKYWFDCPKCKHSFNSILYSIADGNWCPYCSNKKICDSSDCNLCFNNSFASHEKSAFWSSKNEYQPRDVFKSSSKKYWFDCNVCNNEFDSILASVSSGHWCPFCKNKTEAKLYEKMKQIYPSLQTQFRQDWCKRIKPLPYDFCVPELKTLLELDGGQHFRQVRDWKSPEEQFENDKYKEDCANQNGYSVIRLLQEDVYSDTYDWVKELCEAIEQIKSSEGITNIYLSKNGEYDDY
jgi:very-short-patch-repair endonuclease